MHLVKLKYTLKLSAGLGFLVAVVGLVYWLLVVYDVRNWLGLTAIFFFLILPGLASLRTIPNEIRALAMIWRSEDPASVEQALEDLRERGLS